MRGKAICSEPGRAGTKAGDSGRGLQKCEDRNLHHREMKLERVAGASLVVSGRESLVLWILSGCGDLMGCEQESEGWCKFEEGQREVGICEGQGGGPGRRTALPVDTSIHWDMLPNQLG